MALTSPRARPFTQARTPKRLLLIGLAAAVGLGGAYVAIEGNPLARNDNTVVYDSTAARQGTLQVTVSATGFSPGVAPQTAVQAALDLQGVPSTMAVGAPDANIYVRVGTPGTNNLSLNQLQAVRPGGSLSVTFTSDNVNAATLVNAAGGTGSPQTAQIAAGQSNTPTTVALSGVALRRVAAGVASISGAITGLITTNNGTHSVTVQ